MSGRIDRRYSPLVLGGLFGFEDRETSFGRLDTFVELGGTTIDTAHMYADGRAEQVIGDWLAARRATVPRDAVRVIGKVCHPRAGRPRLRPDVIRTEVAESLRRLRTDRLDAVLLHRDDPAIPVETIVETLLDLRQRGMIDHFGVSNWSARRLAAFADAAAPVRPVASYQFSLAVPAGPLWPGARHVTADLLDVIVDRGLCLQGWTALARGWFAGRDPRDRTGMDRDLLVPFDTPTNRAARAAVTELARRRDATEAAVSLAWVLAADLDVHAVIGPRTVAQVRECFGGTDLVLRSPEWSELSLAAGGRGVPGPRNPPVFAVPGGLGTAGTGGVRRYLRNCQ